MTSNDGVLSLDDSSSTLDVYAHFFSRRDECVPDDIFDGDTDDRSAIAFGMACNNPDTASSRWRVSVIRIRIWA